MSGTKEVVDALRERGFDVRPGYLAWLIREGHFTAPAQRIGAGYLWERADVDRLAAALRRRGRAPETALSEAQATR